MSPDRKVEVLLAAGADRHVRDLRRRSPDEAAADWLAQVRQWEDGEFRGRFLEQVAAMVELLQGG